MKTIEINEIDAEAIEELANNRVLDRHSARGRVRRRAGSVPVGAGAGGVRRGVCDAWRAVGGMAGILCPSLSPPFRGCRYEIS